MRQNRRHRGAALVLVLCTIALLTAITVAILDATTLELTLLKNHTHGLRAMYAARAGVAEAIKAIRNRDDFHDTVSGTLSCPDGATASYSATVTRNEGLMTIRATGTAGDFSRGLEARVMVANELTKEAPYPVRVIFIREAAGTAVP